MLAMKSQATALSIVASKSLARRGSVQNLSHILLGNDGSVIKTAHSLDALTQTDSPNPRFDRCCMMS